MTAEDFVCTERLSSSCDDSTNMFTNRKVIISKLRPNSDALYADCIA